MLPPDSIVRRTIDRQRPTKQPAICQWWLASPDRRAEDVGVVAVIVAELKLRDVQRQIFAA
jgi:hypothetical protein